MPEIVSASGGVTIRRYTEAEARTERQGALDSMGITLDEYRRLAAESCHQSCARPEWSERWDRWDDVGKWDYLIGEDE